MGYLIGIADIKNILWDVYGRLYNSSNTWAFNPVIYHNSDFLFY